MLDTITRRTAPAEAPPRTWSERFHDRRRLRRIDRMGARLARLDAVDALLERVYLRLEAGWTQEAWFTTRDAEGLRHHVGTLRPQEGRGSEQACLVAAIAVEALPGSITDGVAQRAVGAMWNVLHGGAAAADWSTPPGVTAARAYDLVRWNDGSGRRKDDVLALVSASRASIARTSDTVRAELATA